jgi:hypothetical protein
VKNQAMVWISAANLHESGRVHFKPSELIDEVVHLFPDSHRPTVSRYVSTATNVSGSLPYSFAYLIRVSPGWYRLTQPVDLNPLGKPRWPDQAEVAMEYLPLRERWVDWQRGSGATPAEEAVALVAEEQADPAVHSTQSTYREAMLEHLLVGELMRYLWPKPLEVCKPQVDAAGYDLIMQSDGVLRHVQLKTSVLTAATASVNLQVELWKRQGGCVIWTRFDPDTLELKEFWWLGGPQQPFPALESLEMARHTKANADGEKGYRPSLRKVQKGCFKRVPSVAELVEHLFGAQ